MYETLVWSVHIYVVGYYMTTKERFTLTSCVFRERKEANRRDCKAKSLERERASEKKTTGKQSGLSGEIFHFDTKACE